MIPDKELESILDAIGDGMRLIDSEFNTLCVNQAFTRFSGIDPTEAVGKKCYEVFYHCLCHTPLCPLVQILQGKNKVEFSSENEREGKKTPYILTVGPYLGSDGRLIGIVQHFRNIVVRKQVQKALEEQLHFVQKLIDTIPNPIYYKDLQGAYQGCNAAFEQCIGLPREEIIGKTVYDLYPTDLADQYQKLDEELLTQQGIQVFEAPFVCAYGVTKHVIYKKATFCSMNGSLGGIVGAIIDITDRKQAEEEREKLIRELQEALAQVKTLSGLLPICASCKKIRDDKGYWNQIEKYISEHSEAEFSHSICPECLKRLYPEYGKKG